ncbi:MAG TPA: glutamate racemase [Clostridiales bacterium]|nr:glutamate racemase [Clostridiales bacterium]
MSDLAIGVFDSGVGGLTAVKELNNILPNENIIYFGDTARIPYGSRSKETILKYANEDINFLRHHGIKMIIAACGTVSSVMNTKALVEDIPFTGVLLPAVQAACGATVNGKIGVIGTQATIKSGSYGRAIKTIRPNSFVVGKACPLFVPLVENGYTDKDNKIARMVVEEYLEPIKNEGVDTLILGCTHYPLLKEIIADIVGEGVTLISAGEEAAKFANLCLLEQNLLNTSDNIGKNTFYVSDSVEMFEENAKQFLGHDVHGDVFKVDINC